VLAGFLVLVVLQRVAELLLSARNARRLRARGGREHGRGHFPLLVLVHTAFPLALAAEVLLGGVRPGPLGPLWAALWVAAQALRYAAIRALGERWNVRIWVVPGAPLVRRGPYRWMPHPNYLAVVIELLSAPLIFGAWRTALGISLLNLLALRVRIHAEERALGEGRVVPG
jgi:methyltransferase